LYRRRLAKARDQGSDAGVGFDAQLLAQQNRVDLGMPDRTGPVARRSERPHEIRSDRRVERAHHREPLAPLDRSARVPRLLGSRGQLGERAHDRILEACALRRDPLLELR
jgi:hypothetical protein